MKNDQNGVCKGFGRSGRCRSWLYILHGLNVRFRQIARRVEDVIQNVAGIASQ